MGAKKKLTPPFWLKIARISIKATAVISAKLSARLLNYVWFRTHRYPEPRREKNLLEQAVWQTQKIGKNTIQLYIWGEQNKPTILLVHGWNGRGAQLGTLTESLVSKGYRVIAFDAPGHGRSSANKTNLLEISMIIQEIVQKFGPLEAGIAHSFGGLCLMHAISAGSQVGKAICIASVFNVERLVQIFGRMLQAPEKVVDRQRKLLEKQFGTDLWQQFSMPDIVRQIDTAGLIIHDENDEDIPVDRSKIIAQNWNNSELIITSGLGHRRILRDKKIISKVTEFIAGR